MLRAAVFDLDHTLFDPRTLPRALFRDLEARVRHVAAGLLSAAVLDTALADAWRLPFDRVIALHRLPDAVTTAWQDAAGALEVIVPLAPYSDVVAGSRNCPCSGFSSRPVSAGCRRVKCGSWG